MPGIPRIRLEILGHGILACGSFREAGGTIWHLGGTSTPDTRYRRYWYAHFRFLIRFITPTNLNLVVRVITRGSTKFRYLAGTKVPGAYFF